MIQNKLMIGTETAQLITGYGDDMHAASVRAQQFRQQTSNLFAEYHDKNAATTCARQRVDLLNFSTYLAAAGVIRTVDQLYDDAAAWSGIREPLVFGYRAWLRQEGYAIGTINIRLATIRAYCDLACQSGAISDEDYKLIRTVKKSGLDPILGGRREDAGAWFCFAC